MCSSWLSRMRLNQSMFSSEAIISRLVALLLYGAVILPIELNRETNVGRQALKYVELELSKSFAFHSLRIKYEPSEGSMFIDLSTIISLELIQNLQDSKSKDCLLGLLDETFTPMGSRLLRSNILQPSTEPEKLIGRYDGLEELTTKEEMFYSVRQGLSSSVKVWDIC